MRLAPCLDVHKLCCLNCLLFVFLLLSPCPFTQDVSPEDVDLENEPWYKFFSEMEFDKAVSGRCSHNDNISSRTACHVTSMLNV